jgi:hypothetical protein
MPAALIAAAFPVYHNREVKSSINIAVVDDKWITRYKHRVLSRVPAAAARRDTEGAPLIRRDHSNIA